MGRNGVSYLDISGVAFELQGKGVNPTVDAVREMLGTGSKSTIGPYLKQWRTQQEQGGKQTDLSLELSSVVKGLYSQLQEQANAKMEEFENNLRSEIATLQQQLQETMTNNSLLNYERQINEREINLLNKELTLLRAQVFELNKTSDELNVTLRVTYEEKQQLESEWLTQRGKIMGLQEQINITCNETNLFNTRYKTLQDEYLYSEEKRQLAEDALKNVENERLYLIQERATLANEIKEFEKNMALS